MFKKSIAVVTIGDVHFGLQDTEQAMQLIRILADAVSLDSWMYSVSQYTDAEYALAETAKMPQLKFVPESAIDGQNTVKEIKERGDREKKDREDMEQQFAAAPMQLTAPDAPVAPPEVDTTEEFF